MLSLRSQIHSQQKLPKLSRAHVDDIDEAVAARNIGIAINTLEESTMKMMARAYEIGMAFTLGQSEVIHFSIMPRVNPPYKECLLVQFKNVSSTVPANSHIRLLDVTIDDTLSFSPHAQNAGSKGLQVLGGFFYLRKGNRVTSPLMARHLVVPVARLKVL
jgi:hypothetical protein